jgi:hypothetical protein
VDTPGFMDTGGLLKDQKIEFDIKGYILKNLEMVHSIALVT